MWVLWVSHCTWDRMNTIFSLLKEPSHISSWHTVLETTVLWVSNIDVILPLEELAGLAALPCSAGVWKSLLVHSKPCRRCSRVWEWAVLQLLCRGWSVWLFPSCWNLCQAHPPPSTWCCSLGLEPEDVLLPKERYVWNDRGLLEMLCTVNRKSLVMAFQNDSVFNKL